MSYYSDKKRAFTLIKSLYGKGVNKEIIKLKIMDDYGYGASIVDKYIEQLEKVGETTNE